MFQKIDHIEEIVQRGISAQHKTIEGIFEFARCVVDLKNECTKIQGGSEFSIIAKDRWGISQSASSMWLKIGNSKKLITNGNKFKLPLSWKTIYHISNLTEEQLKIGVDEGIINSEATRQDIIEFKNRLNAPKIQPKEIEIEVEDTPFDESNFVVKKQKIFKPKENKVEPIISNSPELKEVAKYYYRIIDEVYKSIEDDSSDIDCYRTACNYIGVVVGTSTEVRDDVPLIVLRKRLQDYKPKGQEKASKIYRKLIKCKEFIK